MPPQPGTHGNLHNAYLKVGPLSTCEHHHPVTDPSQQLLEAALGVVCLMDVVEMCSVRLADGNDKCFVCH